MTDSDVKLVCDALGVKPEIEHTCHVPCRPHVCDFGAIICCDNCKANDWSHRTTVEEYPAGAALLEALKAALTTNVNVIWFRTTFSESKAWYVTLTYFDEAERRHQAETEEHTTELDALVAACKEFCGKAGE